VVPISQIALSVLRLYLPRHVWMAIQCAADGLGDSQTLCHGETSLSQWEVEEQQDINIAWLRVIEGALFMARDRAIKYGRA